jgi:hypothetical protein
MCGPSGSRGPNVPSGITSAVCSIACPKIQPQYIVINAGMYKLYVGACMRSYKHHHSG